MPDRSSSKGVPQKSKRSEKANLSAMSRMILGMLATVV